jgi:hypothetical protein
MLTIETIEESECISSCYIVSDEMHDFEVGAKDYRKTVLKLSFKQTRRSADQPAKIIVI